jgi:putative peptidoglycan lipid II flippase
MSNMLKSSGAMAAATLLSRVLGMVRTMVYTSFMGTSAVADAFTLAFKIPNLFRRLLGEGALTAAFIPIFKKKQMEGNPAEMWRAANAVLSGLIVAGTALSVIVILGITVALPFVVDEVDKPSKILMLQLLRIMFPYVLLVCVAAVFIGILNAKGHFFIPALGSVALNVVLIGVVWVVVPMFGKELPRQIFGLAWGVLIAGLVQMLFQYPTLMQEGFRPTWVAPWTDPTVREVLVKMIPGTLGVASFQINVVVNDLLAIWRGDGLVSSFDCAVRLMELPQGLFGISLATYLLPTLSGLAAEKKFPEFRKTLAEGMGHLVFVNLLASVFLVVLAEPMIRLLFERGQFDAYSTSLASTALAFLGPGLIAFSLVNILARAFYAVGDVSTPMRISVFCLLANLILTAILIWPMKQAGMGLANTMSALMNVGLLAFALRKKLKTLAWTELRASVQPLVGAALAASLVCWGSLKLWTAQIGHAALWSKAGEVFVPMLLSGALYLGVSWWLKVRPAREILGMVLDRIRR